MNCLHCQSDQTKRFGKDRKGHQRFRCLSCKKTFQEPRPKPLGRMTLAEEKALSVLHHICEGCSIRSTERLTGVNRDTIIDLLLLVGQKCGRLTEKLIHGLRVSEVQCDEVWDYIGMKEKTKTRKGLEDASLGDAWTFTAIERHSKLILAWHLGRRTEADTVAFTEKLAYATEGNFQVTTDGFKPYQHAIVLSLGAQYVDFAQLVKLYSVSGDPDTRYSPAECIGARKVAIYGNPDMSKVCTSHVERQNLNIRMAMRRFTRLTNAFSKKWAMHYAAQALSFAYYNFCRVHLSLRVTPAMEAGVTDHIWSLKELIG
jgi:transposase-like protein/IS1 family transposase